MTQGLGGASQAALQGSREFSTGVSRKSTAEPALFVLRNNQLTCHRKTQPDQNWGLAALATK